MKTAAIRITSFLLLVAGIILTSLWLMTSSQFSVDRSLLAIGSSVDIALLIPLIYFFFIRKTSIPNITIIPVFVLSLIVAFQVIPNEHHTTLNSIEMLLAPIELGVIGFLIFKVYQINKRLGQKEGSLRNFPERMKEVLQSLKANPLLANVVTSESALFYYTFMGWKKPQELQEAEFSHYKKSGYRSVFILVLFLLPVETFVLHYWLISFSPILAWVLTGLSTYSLFFLFGDRNSLRHRPIAVKEDFIQMTVGLRWNFELPYDMIDKMEQREGDEHAEKFANLSSFGHGNMVISLKEPMKIEGIYGIKKITDKLVLSIDDSQKFYQEVNEKIIE